MSFFPKAKSENIVIQELDKEILIYNLELNKAASLNESSAAIWKLCDGQRSVSDIAETLGRRLGAPISKDFVWLAIDQLHDEDLLSNKSEAKPRFRGLTRREVIKKVGVTSMVALPIVSSIVAPAAVSAQTGGFACVVGTCIPDGAFVCPPCTGMSITLDRYTSTDGSCTGPVTPSAVFVMCGLGAGFPGGDLEIAMVA